MGTGPWDDGAEHEAARLLSQLSEYTSTLVGQEVRRAQLQRERSGVNPRDRRLKAGDLLVLLGAAAIVAAGVIVLAHVLGAGLASLTIGATLLTVSAVIRISGSRRASRASNGTIEI